MTFENERNRTQEEEKVSSRKSPNSLATFRCHLSVDAAFASRREVQLVLEAVLLVCDLASDPDRCRVARQHDLERRIEQHHSAPSVERSDLKADSRQRQRRRVTASDVVTVTKIIFAQQLEEEK